MKSYKKYISSGSGYFTYYYNQKGHFHRENGPAIISPDKSTQVWYRNGLRHRKNGPAFIDTKKNIYIWSVNGIATTVDKVLSKEAALWWTLKHGGNDGYL